MRWYRGIALVLLLSQRREHAVVDAQRGESSSICDYYAAKRYGANNGTTQLLLMQGIVALAYAGGSALSNPSALATSGIFNPGTYNRRSVYLRPWFDGSKPTSNWNGVAVGVNWLDGGGLDPLVAFLNGSTERAEIRKGSNQEKLFTHWYYVFGKLYSCSRYKEFLDKEFTAFNPAYVHKYMDLNQTHVGYFIAQMGEASRYYGFEESDATTLVSSMQSKYNVRCLPPENNSLTSICLAKECPLAVPSPHCEAYENIQPRGVETSGLPSSTSSSSAASPGSEGHAHPLSGGAIAGIAVGGAAVVVLLAIGTWFLYRRQRRSRDQAAGPVQSIAPSSTLFSPQSPYGSQYSPNPHESYIGSFISSPSQAWAEPKPIQELSTGSPDMIHCNPSPGGPNSQPTMDQIAEMGGSEPPPEWGRYEKPSNTH